MSNMQKRERVEASLGFHFFYFSLSSSIHMVLSLSHIRPRIHYNFKLPINW